jgi:hypothetical protein
MAQEVLNIAAEKTDGFNASFEPIHFNGYNPKYKILSDYSHLIEAGDYSRKITGEGFEATLKSIPEVIQKYHYQVRKLARHLYTGNYKQDAFHVWHFLTTNIKFKNDAPGFEELRSPARSWRDRFTGIDCDCFTNFAICLFLEMNYMPYAKIVEFNNKGQFGHIYTVLNEMIIDPVMKTFNLDPPCITKIHKLMITNVILNGLGDINHSPTPYEAEVAARLMGYINSQSQKLRSGKFNAKDFSNLKKAQYLLFINPLPERELIAELMASHVKDFHKNGNMIFQNKEINGLLYGSLEGGLEGNVYVSEETNEELERIGQIFDLIDEAYSSDLGSLKTLIKKLAPKNVIKKTVQVIKKVTPKAALIKKIAKNVLVKYNPAFAIPRAAFLVLVNLNVFNLGFKLSLGYMTLQQFQADGGDASEYQKCVDVKNKTEKLFETVGGSLDQLRKAVEKGKERKAARVERRALRKAKKQGVTGLMGLGDAGISEAASVASSATIWGKILAWFKNINWKKFAGKLGKKALEGQTEEEIITDQELNPDGTVPEDLQQNFSSSGGFPAWGWLLIGLGVLGIGYVAFNK